MTLRSIEPLDPQTWLDRLAKLHGEALGDTPRSSEALLRQAYHLTKLAPGPYRQLLPVDLDEDRVERMLDCGAHESAVMALLGTKLDFSVRKDARAKRFEAEVAIDPKSPPGRGSHEDCAKAVLCAWVCSLSHLAGLEGPGGPKGPDRRKYRSGSPRNSTEH